ncbi:putative eukaryotic initiation factor 2B epsilon subunit [Toxoplasma gondii GAB2-2007-GAL-DOM2]|uniref:Putative eukaryotic initiation factor 2B epsilon subunit n=4 Tax=Toxoplasma gondii TaxID=5811 RepID=S7V3K4_TOXGG|nr:putative eukaryotic initiation factor 2B epsilon subunit [Toxoplasma gondii GT1]KAF4641972.1 putative eukaryotic initiation factor 2B epsilon subunit [Toxoplasma gondii]KFG48988.1 putative eukaryotic initiation factor 2B epsilon subunit [Toxoplasma gondii GAB2-2007-GAL-DOM2]
MSAPSSACSAAPASSGGASVPKEKLSAEKQAVSSSPNHGSGKKCASAPRGADEDTQFDCLPAILVALTLPELKETFAPLCYESLTFPLLPVSGVPLVVSAFDFLARNGVTEIFVLIKGDEEGWMVKRVVEEHEETFQKRLRRVVKRGLRVTCVEVPTTVESMGDALRDFSSKYDLRHDFLLMHVSSFIRADIRPAIAAHKERTATKFRGVSGGEAVMTQLLARASPSNAQRLLDDDVALLVESQTKEVIASFSLKKRAEVELGEDLIQLAATPSSCGFQVHYDLVDIGVYLCAPKVQELFSVSFDYVSVKRDFIPDLINREIKLDAIYAYVLETQEGENDVAYASCCTDPRTYYHTCREALERWTYPLVPDTRTAGSGHAPQLRYRGRGVYQADSVSPGLRCELGPLVAIEDSTTIGDGTTIRHSFIGSKCKIGRNVLIEGSILFGNVEICDNVKISNSLLFTDIKILEDTRVGDSCVLGGGVTIGRGRVVPPFTRIFLPSRLRKSEAEVADAVAHADAHTEKEIIGEDGEGRLWPMQRWSTEKLQTISLGCSTAPFIKLPLPSFAVDEDESSEEEESDDEAVSDGEASASSPVASHKRDQGDDSAFASEIRAMCQEGLSEPQHMQHKVLEMKSFRLASNKTDLEVAQVILPVFLETIAFAADGGAPKKDTWEKFIATRRAGLLFSSFLSNAHPEDLVPLWSICLDFCMRPTRTVSVYSGPQKEGEGDDTEAETVTRDNPLFGSTVFCSLCEVLHSCDLLDADLSLPLWYRHKTQGDLREDEKAFLNSPRLKAFVEWLEEEDASDEDDE